MRKLLLFLMIAVMGVIATPRKKKDSNDLPPLETTPKEGVKDEVRSSLISTLIERSIDVASKVLGPVVTAALLWGQLHIDQILYLALVIVGVGIMILLVANYLKGK